MEIEGNDELGSGDITESLATRATPKFAWLVRGLFYDYETYNPHVLSRDLLRIRRLYHSHGFHHAQVNAGRVVVSEDRVHVTVVVDEGPQTRVRTVHVAGLDQVDDAVRVAAVEAFTSELPIGSEYDEEQLQEANDLLTRSLQDRGYAYAKAEFSAQVDLPRSLADLHAHVVPGPLVTLGSIELRGFRKIPQDVVRSMLNLKPGDLYRKTSFVEAEQELINLGVFNSVTVKLAQESLPSDSETTAPDDATSDKPDDDASNTSSVSNPSSSSSTIDAAQSSAAESEPEADGASLGTKKRAVVPVTIEVHQSQLRSLTLGGGLEADIIKSDVHLTASWRDQNLLGGLRDLLISVTPGVALYPTRVPEFATPQHYLPEVKTRVEFSQPGIPERRTKTVASINYDIYPVLLTPNPADDAPVIGYRELRARTGLERKFGPVALVPSYNFHAGVPFAYLGGLAETATDVYISYIELLAELDLRNERISPSSGIFASTTVQFAGLGGSARDLRIEPEFRGYVPVVRDKSGFAGRVKLGFLFPFNYDTPHSGGDVSVEDTQIAFFRSFFSGGPQSNRGYPFRGVGPHGAVEFFYPTYEEAVQGIDCSSSTANRTPECSIPLGGRTLWEASLAFRFTISGPFTAALFCDASDVDEGSVWPSFARPHLSCGLGPRYDTPVGPIRLDVGYRIPGLQVLDDSARNEGPAEDLLGLPINISFGVGEAF